MALLILDDLDGHVCHCPEQSRVIACAASDAAIVSERRHDPGYAASGSGDSQESVSLSWHARLVRFLMGVDTAMTDAWDHGVTPPY